jgi:16S rRNA processing protein RimM
LSEGRRVLIPFVTPIVPRVEIGEGWLEITPPPGLLDT